ncbi:MAG TPA: metallophosphoesterase family protein [Xanthomonadales bacterium]|nr:metallophosphoesterase family protein [Xanthomonadales bacterium]
MVPPLFKWGSRSGARPGASTDDVPAAKLPPGEKIYCIGDIHGRDDLLLQLHDMIIQDAADFEGSKIIVYLGDYIDRGPQTRQVVDRLLNSPLAGFQSIHLRGNHEQALLDFLQDSRAMAAWMNWGGIQTLASYGVSLPPSLYLEHMELLARQLKQNLPEDHLQFFESLAPCYLSGDYYFVHAGIRPGVPLVKQELGDQLWIREEFTRSSQQHEAVIVHGHSITTEAQLLPNRIGIDTGAFHTGVLTALVLEADTQRLLQTGREAQN